MTSFEPEHFGHLIDNMELRRLNLDQARQLTLHARLAQVSNLSGGQVRQQRVAEAASTVAIAAAAAASAALASTAGGNTPAATPTKQQAGQQQPKQQQNDIAITVAAAATAAAMANLNINQQPHTTANICASGAASRHYSLVMNPSVYLLGEDAATIAYTKLNHTLDLDTGRLQIEQSEETRVWHKRDGKRWLCVHLHRSLAGSNSYLNMANDMGGQSYNANNNAFNANTLAAAVAAATAASAATSGANQGPQTSASLIRSMISQQQLATAAGFVSQQQQQQSSVPLISLNHSSSSQQSIGRQQQSQQQQQVSGNR